MKDVNLKKPIIENTTFVAAEGVSKPQLAHEVSLAHHCLKQEEVEFGNTARDILLYKKITDEIERAIGVENSELAAEVVASIVTDETTEKDGLQIVLKNKNTEAISTSFVELPVGQELKDVSLVHEGSNWYLLFTRQDETTFTCSINSLVTDYTAKISSEETRAAGVEDTLSEAIIAEAASRASGDTETLTAAKSYTDTETTRATGVEAELSETISTVDTGAVHKSGPETITGKKTFRGSQVLADGRYDTPAYKWTFYVSGSSYPQLGGLHLSSYDSAGDTGLWLNNNGQSIVAVKADKGYSSLGGHFTTSNNHESQQFFNDLFLSDAIYTGKKKSGTTGASKSDYFKLTIPTLTADSPIATVENIAAETSARQTAITELTSAVNAKVAQVTTADKVYGTDNNGNQTTYDIGSFGQVDDVQVDNVSVVENKVAKIDLSSVRTAIETEASARETADTEINERIDSLQALGRYLSGWNATTGLPDTDPAAVPYTYKTGDYYIITEIADESGEVNYKPNGKTYTGEASTVVETDEIHLNDYYSFDGTIWKVIESSKKEVAFASIVGLPSDNRTLKTALDLKADSSSLSAVATSGQYADLSGLPVIINAVKIDYNYNNATLSGIKIGNSSYKLLDFSASANGLAIGTGAKTYLTDCKEISFDGITSDDRHVLSLYSLENIFFRNEDILAGKTTRGLYTSGKTLKNYLDEKSTVVMSSSAEESGIETAKYITVDGITYKIESGSTLPEVPEANGSYTLTAVRSNGEVTYEWATSIEASLDDIE